MEIVDRGIGSLRYRASARYAYLDLHTEAEHTILVAGSRRSGTTWLGEVINYRNDRRTMFEPFHPLHSSWARRGRLEWAHYSEPEFADAALFEMCTRLWSGRVRDGWVDKHNTKRIASRRLVKCVECTNLLPWIARRFPHVRMTYLVRHPFAVAESQMSMTFQDDGLTDLDVLRHRTRLLEGVYGTLPDSARARELIERSSDRFENHVIRWCLENRIPMSMLDRRQAHVLFYEDLVLHTRDQLARLGHHLTMRFDSTALQAARKPSRTDFRNRAKLVGEGVDPVEFVGAWRDSVSVEDVARGLAVLEAFDLDHVYSDEVLPLLAADDLLDATDRASRLPEEVGRPVGDHPVAPAPGVRPLDQRSGSVDA
jgi:hypothetical protein